MAEEHEGQHKWQKQGERVLCTICGRERAPKGRGSVVKRGNYYMAQIRIRGVTHAKHGFPSRTAAEQWLNRTKRENEDGTLARPSNMTVGQWLREWLDLGGGDRPWKPNTRYGYERIVELYLLPAFGRTRLQSLSSVEIQAQFSRWREEGLPSADKKKRRIPSAGRLLNVHRCFNKALKDAMYHGKVGSNPMARVRAPRVEDRHRPELWSVEQTRHFIESSRNSRYHAVYCMLIGTGCRVGELLALTWDDVDLDGGKVSINKSAGTINREEVVTEPKTRAGTRLVGLPAFAVTALRGWKAQQAEELLKLRPRPEHGRVFTNPDGTPLRSSQMRRTYIADMKAAGLTQLRFHDLRHAAASLMLADGVPIPIVSNRLGHANSNITMGTYAHMLRDDDRLAVAAMDRIFGK